jgi:hypothetical protein
VDLLTRLLSVGRERLFFSWGMLGCTELQPRPAGTLGIPSLFSSKRCTVDAIWQMRPGTSVRQTRQGRIQALPLLHRAQQPGLMPLRATHREGLGHGGFRHHQAEANAEVEGIP